MVLTMSGHTPWREIKHKNQKGRPAMDDEATKNLKPEDETQTTPKGLRLGLLRKSEVMADFKKIVRGKKP
jgi:hypothetical protein